MLELRKRNHPQALKETDIGEYWPNQKLDVGEELSKREEFLDSFLGDISRDDQKLIELIEEWGSERVSSKLAKLKIVEIPDGIKWEIDDYDGQETVREKHRSWY